MGVEAFGVSLNFVQSGVYEQVYSFLQNRPQIHLRDEEKNSSQSGRTGEYRDDSHFIDLQLSRIPTTNKCTLAIRFSLCSYETIDPIFITLVSDIISSYEAETWLMTSELKQKTNYLPGDEKWLISALPEEISAMRRHWQKLFGSTQGSVRVKDSFSFVGLKLKK
jgi:hypothetical protein